jgi:hypothetical protein
MFSLVSKINSTALAFTLTILGVTPALPDDFNSDGGRHVLLISIDGLQALDFENCVNTGTCPNLKSLAETGVNYTLNVFKSNITTDSSLPEVAGVRDAIGRLCKKKSRGCEYERGGAAAHT